MRTYKPLYKISLDRAYLNLKCVEELSSVFKLYRENNEQTVQKPTSIIREFKKPIQEILNSDSKLIYIRDWLIENAEVPQKIPQDMKLVNTIILSNNHINDIRVLSHFDNLNMLSLGINKIESMIHLVGLKEIMHLTLGINKINSLYDICHFKKLHYLDLGVNNISNIESITKLQELITLDLGYNPIKNFTPIKYLKKLRYLHFRGKKIDLRNFTILGSL